MTDRLGFVTINYNFSPVTSWTMAFSWQRSLSSVDAICSICLEEKKERRRLRPCLHSFCRRCLERHCENKSPGSDVPCPLCRTTFQIPPNGLDGWADPIDREKRCEACSTDADVKPADVYCVDCSQLLCERCSLPHKKMPGGSHSVVRLAERREDEIASQLELASRGPASACRDAVANVASQRREFLESARKAREQVKERGEAVKRVVDGHVEDLLAKIAEIESDTLKEASALTEILKTALSAATVGPDIQPASELLTTCIEATCYKAPDVAFIPRDIDELTRDENNTVGSVLASSRNTGE